MNIRYGPALQVCAAGLVWEMKHKQRIQYCVVSAETDVYEGFRESTGQDHLINGDSGKAASRRKFLIVLL